jgi:hypothetical protein
VNDFEALNKYNLARRFVVKISDLVCAAGFVFNVKLALFLPDRVDWLCLDVVIAVRRAEDVPGNALARYPSISSNLAL